MPPFVNGILIGMVVICVIFGGLVLGSIIYSIKGGINKIKHGGI